MPCCLLESGRDYVIFGTGRLTGNEDCTQPKFTVTHAVPLAFGELPVHYVHIMVAVDLKTAPKLSTDGNTYTFEGAVSGYYSDPVPASQRNNRLQRSQSTHVTTQYFYADVSPRLERVLGSMQPSTKVFVDGDYRFPVEGESTPGYIEVRNVTFNTTNRSAQGGAPTDGTKASGGTAGNRRSVLQLHRTSSNFQSYGVEYRRSQLPVINAFGLTIHKVQGLSLPSVTLALNKSIFSDGQAYVGLSRATTSERLFLTQLDFDAIKADPETIAEYNRLRTLADRLET
ncbi:hypothetical protein V8E54_002628 [Elaphomyces granulatus]